MAYSLGIDTSTTSSKALLMNEHGEVVAVASSPHTLQIPGPLCSEQHRRERWEAVSASIHSVYRELYPALKSTFMKLGGTS